MKNDSASSYILFVFCCFMFFIVYLTAALYFEGRRHHEASVIDAMAIEGAR